MIKSLLSYIFLGRVLHQFPFISSSSRLSWWWGWIHEFWNCWRARTWQICWSRRRSKSSFFHLISTSSHHQRIWSNFQFLEFYNIWLIDLIFGFVGVGGVGGYNHVCGIDMDSEVFIIFYFFKASFTKNRWFVGGLMGNSFLPPPPPQRRRMISISWRWKLTSLADRDPPHKTWWLLRKKMLELKKKNYYRLLLTYFHSNLLNMSGFFITIDQRWLSLPLCLL